LPYPAEHNETCDFNSPPATYNPLRVIRPYVGRELPERARILMLKGADVIFNPLGCTCPTSDLHRWLLRTRAFEDEVFIFMVNQAAPRENGHTVVLAFESNFVKEMDEKDAVFVRTST
jgi:predicted amidohydrolase